MDGYTSPDTSQKFLKKPFWYWNLPVSCDIIKNTSIKNDFGKDII